MKGDFQVSVIVPVYNAEKFIKDAVFSAKDIEVVREIILIEDGSTDNSLKICQQLQLEIPKVILLTHEGGGNRGAGASRNLGIKNALYPFIAFLDADDFFLPERFTLTQPIFEQDKDVMGVYEPVGTNYVDGESAQKFAALKKLDQNELEGYISYVKKPYEGRIFFESLIDGKNGFPQTDGIVFRKSLLEKAGFFNENLRLHQDSEFWIRLSYHGFFKPTSDFKHIVAIRNVHPGNRINKRSIATQAEFYKSLYDWAEREVTEISFRKEIKRKYYEYYIYNKFGKHLFSKVWLKLNRIFR